MVGEPGTETVTGEDFPRGRGEPALLTDVRAASHDGFDRVVLQFQGEDEPTYRVTYIEPPVRQDGSGNEIDVDGRAFLELQVQPASRFDMFDDASRVYEGADRIQVDGRVVSEIVLTGDYEAHLTWVAGLRRRTPFAVTLLRDPLRLVVDIVHP